MYAAHKNFLNCRNIVAIATLCGIIAETILRWPHPPQGTFHISYLLMPLMALFAVLSMMIFPAIGVWIVITVYCVGLVSPFPMTYSLTLGMIESIVVIWKSSPEGKAPAILAAIMGITALLVDAKFLFGLGLADSVVISFAYCVFSLLIVIISRVMTQRSIVSERLERYQQQQQIASLLHDNIANDLAYTIMLTNRMISDTDHMNVQELTQLRSALVHSLDETHSVIRTLDESEPQKPQSTHDHTQPLSMSSDTAPLTKAALQAYIDEQERKLASLGCQGTTIIADDISLNALATTTALITRCLTEIYANILKHADPNQGYVVSITSDARGRLIITSVDTPRQSTTDSDSIGMHSGLQRLKQGVESHGGTLLINTVNNQWMLTITIPTNLTETQDRLSR